MDANLKWISYRRMARAMAKMLPPCPPVFLNGAYVRAGGDVLCSTCQLPYIEHPMAPEETLGLHVLCDGLRVKL